PLDGLNYTSSVAVEGRGPEGAGLEVVHRRADAGYFEAVRTPLLEGRSFQATDRPDGPPVVVVNETFARQIFPGEDPIGRRIAYDRVPTEESVWYVIVGVVGDQRQQSPGIPPRMEVFENRRQDWSRTTWVVVRAAAAARALPAVRAVLHDLDPLIPLEAVRPLREVWRSSMAREDLVLALLGAYAVLALLLAAAGVFAVTLQAARRRTREIGVRMALGAARDDLVRLMLRQGLGAVGLGILAGLLACLAAARVLESLLYGVEPDDPATLATVAGILLGVAGAACWVPARWATRVDPVRALRE
ncbi:MAG TPA: ABC transporter permease, partial [Longimicrobiales bacterium]|nr:ABC transporter permease [Longimicrobiales bacterium]